MFSVNTTKSKCPVDLVTFTEEILNRKLHFLYSDCWRTKTFIVKWIAKSISYKPYSLKKLLIPKTPKSRKSNTINRQDNYEFWVKNSIAFNNSNCSVKPIPKMNFFKEIERYQRSRDSPGGENLEERF